MRHSAERVIVVGGGAAGMAAAIGAAGTGVQVTLFEQNPRVGRKLFITGKGRCNVTNACETLDFFDHVLRGGKFLLSAVYSFDHDAISSLLETNGCPLKTERGGRVFPVSDHSSDVIQTLLRILENAGVEIRTNAAVKKLCLSDDQKNVKGVIPGTGETVEAKRVIIATGGLSYPSTGATGDGYRFAKAAGHTVTPCVPALVPLRVREAWCKELQGLSLRNVSVRYRDFHGQGEMLFTHFGVSGPLVLTASSYYEAKGDKVLHLDLKPALSFETLDARLIREFDENRNKHFKNAAASLFPAKLLPVMVRLSGIDPDKRAGEVTKEERQNFARIIKDLQMTVTGTGTFDEAIVTRGGISLKEINPSTMESLRVKGLFFAGEVLDLDAETGGYNLQIAWSTGYLAGISAGEGSQT